MTFCTISRLHTRLTPRPAATIQLKHSPPDSDTRPSREAVRTRAAGAGLATTTRSACLRPHRTHPRHHARRTTHTHSVPGTGDLSDVDAGGAAVTPGNSRCVRPNKYTHRHTRTDTGSLLRARRASVITRHADAAHPMSTQPPRSLSHILQNKTSPRRHPVTHVARAQTHKIAAAQRQSAASTRPQTQIRAAPALPEHLGPHRTHTGPVLVPPSFHAALSALTYTDTAAITSIKHGITTSARLCACALH